jgi:predicted 3-demethylubiquinone-9 3-methyltransferase (glyoxalase superfamily)
MCSDLAGWQFWITSKNTLKAINNHSMQTITPHLWYDKEAKEAAEFYVSAFPDSKVTNVTTLRDTPSGDTDVVSFELLGHPFMAISAGPLFKFNPSISFIVGRVTQEEVDTLWEKLSKAGSVLMPLDTYPFSKRYGWLQDKYGLSWQLILTTAEADERPGIVPSLLFVGEMHGKAEEAINFYLSVFRHSKIGSLLHYGPKQEPEKEGTVMFADFRLENTWLAAMDSARMHDFGFNEAISFMVYNDTQEDVDYYWNKLSAVPEAEQCGWLKDKYGVSWQIVPTRMDRMMQEGTPEQIARVTQAFLKMKKFDLAELERAYKG